MAEKRRGQGKAEDQDGRKDEGDHDGLLYRCENRRADGKKVAWITSGGPVEPLIAMDVIPVYPENHGAMVGGEQDGGGPLREGGGDGLFERPLFLCPRRYRLRPDQRRADRRPPAARHARLLQQHLRDRPEMVRGAGPVFQGSALHPRHPPSAIRVFPRRRNATSRGRSTSTLPSWRRPAGRGSIMTGSKRSGASPSRGSGSGRRSSTRR